MIKLLIEALKTDNFYGVSYYIDVAREDTNLLLHGKK